MKYELWVSGGSRDEDACCYSFFPEDHENARTALEADAKLLKIFEAENWEDACKQKHAFLGWEPYRPMDET